MIKCYPKVVAVTNSTSADHYDSHHPKKGNEGVLVYPIRVFKNDQTYHSWTVDRLISHQ